MTKHGPYTAQVFTPHQPTICVVCQQSVKGQVEQFLDKFNQGIKLPPPRDPAERQTNYFEKGFCRKYALPDIQYEFFLAESSSVDSYKKACQRAIEEHGSGRKWDRESARLLAESFYERSEITSLLPRRLSIVAVLQVGLCDALASLWGARAAAFAPVQAAAPFVMPGC